MTSDPIQSSAGLTSYIGLLRAVNLGPHNCVAMADLRELMDAMGYADARTLLHSGNIIFRSKDRSAAAIERALEQESATRLGISTDVFVRSAAEWSALIDANPFPKEATSDPGHLLAVVLKKEPTAKNVAALQQAITGRETVSAKGRCAYIVYPDGVGRSKLTSLLIEKMLGTRGTARNWNTVLKLAALVG